MITEEITNKIDTLFPNLTNANAEGNTFRATELWKGVADKSTDTIASIVAPIKNFILDVQPDLQVRNPNACPVVQVEVISTMGGAIVDGDDWAKSAIESTYVPVTLHRISRPFMLTSYDLMRGERVETKVAAAMKEVAQGVNMQFMKAISKVSGSELLTKFDPETCATISGVFGDNAEVDTLLLDPANYAKIVPTNALALNPDAEGAYGIGHIYKAAGMTAHAGAPIVALTKDAIAGAVATPEVVTTYGGQGMQYLGEVGGIPMVLISSWDYDKQCIKCSVETMAGFAITANTKIAKYSF